MKTLFVEVPPTTSSTKSTMTTGELSYLKEETTIEFN